jgi:hypothetical protein
VDHSKIVRARRVDQGTWHRYAGEHGAKLSEMAFSSSEITDTWARSEGNTKARDRKIETGESLQRIRSAKPSVAHVDQGGITPIAIVVDEHVLSRRAVLGSKSRQTIPIRSAYEYGSGVSLLYSISPHFRRSSPDKLPVVYPSLSVKPDHAYVQRPRIPSSNY